MPQEKVKNLKSRAIILRHIREWFEKNSFIEVETPILVNCPDLSPNLNILETEIHFRSPDTSNQMPQVLNDHAVNYREFQRHPEGATKERAKDPMAYSDNLPHATRHGILRSYVAQNDANYPTTREKKYLITSPEFSMKKLLANDGLDNIYTITKVFRDGEEDTGIHSIEFTMLEWYRKNADYNDIMKDTGDIISFISANVETGFVKTGFKPVFTTTPFPRLK
ncbi:MAG: amino acid--tRNA ligase-related protein, partial [bacterium]